MKFVHIADLHLDCPFVALAQNENMAIQRRIEQRQVLANIVEYIRDNHITYFFIAGDLYEHSFINQSTIHYVNQLFQSIPDTTIFITPGNHDPYLQNSFYHTYQWAKNVHIFKKEIERIELPEVDIYGYGFDDFYMEKQQLEGIIKNPKKINILITHGDLEASETSQNTYNPLKTKELKMLGFDYIALGHIHKKSDQDAIQQKIVYPGSTISLGFDELGERGMIVGDIEKERCYLEFIPVKSKQFLKQEIDITGAETKEDVLQKIHEYQWKKDCFYELILTGTPENKINPLAIMELLDNEMILRIKDQTKEKYEIDIIAEKQNLTGIFAKKIKQQMKTASEEQKEKLRQAFEIGMDVLKNNGGKFN